MVRFATTSAGRWWGTRATRNRAAEKGAGPAAREPGLETGAKLILNQIMKRRRHGAGLEPSNHDTYEAPSPVRDMGEAHDPFETENLIAP